MNKVVLPVHFVLFLPRDSRANPSGHRLRVLIQVEDLAKEFGDVVAQTGDKGGKSGVVRSRVSRQGDEGDVFSAGAFYPPAADDALAVPEKGIS
jgi:hypothetical protein